MMYDGISDRQSSFRGKRQSNKVIERKNERTESPPLKRGPEHQYCLQPNVVSKATIVRDFRVLYRAISSLENTKVQFEGVSAKSER